MRTRMVVTCFLEHDGRLLVLRRSQKVGTYRGKWAGVSGSIEAASALDQALNEIAEETGLQLGDVQLLLAGEPLEVVDEESGVKWIVHPFLFHVADPSPIRLDWEHSESRWTDPSEITKLDTVPMLRETWERLLPPEKSPDE